jgi:excinuclease ABC subunit A
MTERRQDVPGNGVIRMRGVRVNNLKNVDLDIPHGQFLALCGLSGSGKTSLALDTLFAEGQRRYIECFSPYTRQFLEQLEKPEADHIDGIPPAIAVTASRRRGNARTTIGSVTETIEFLRLLFARAGSICCYRCQATVTRHSPQEIVQQLQDLPEGCKFQVAFPVHWETGDQFAATAADIKRNGFQRVIMGQASYRTDGLDLANFAKPSMSEMLVVVDRLKTGPRQASRSAESLETAFFYGHGTAVILRESADGDAVVDDLTFEMRRYNNRLICGSCHTEYPEPDAGLFSFNNPKGACSACEGFGAVHFLDMEKIVPDPSLSVRDGAIAPWNTPAYRHELDELIAIAKHHRFPLDRPFSELSEKHLDLLWQGDRSRDFGGLNGFFRWLERRKYKMHLRIFLSRWRSYRDCPECDGQRLNPVALSFQVDGLNIARMGELSIDRLWDRLQRYAEGQAGHKESVDLINMILVRLGYLREVGVGYLALGRSLRTLSSGERQRVALTRALGSNLVNLLYVLDEPSAGLHADDIRRLIPQIGKLRQRRNTVVMVDHDPCVIAMADRVVEIGPAAGRSGGQVVFDGSPPELQAAAATVTGQFLAGERGSGFSAERRDSRGGMIRLSGARGHNLKNITVNFPLNLLCVVAGVSGSGKSTLVRQTLAPALKARLEDSSESALAFDALQGGDHFDQVAIIDQSALPRVSRSNPATYVKAWDEIRKVLASTTDAKTRQLKPGAFSFNVEGGRCQQCLGDGYLKIDMQFMADVLRRCPTCRGTRFREEVCQVRYRQRNVAELLEMTAKEAFSFFRGHRKVQSRLKLLKDVGLGYVPLGQPVSTLSSGEAQRLRLAAFLGRGGQKRTLFVMDQPTSGLHPADVIRLLDSFDSLIDVGHSLIVIEHNLLMLANADYIIDLGPGPAERGGTVVAAGTPEQVCDHPDSVTARYLRPLLLEAVS